MSINKRVRVSYRYVRRGQTSLWDCVGKDTEETVPDDLWRETPVYVGEHDDKSEWIYVQVEQSVQSEDEEEAEDDAQDQADRFFQRRHPEATLT